jgi:hypothetical protein
MSDTKKLERQVTKAEESLQARRAELDSAIFSHAQAVAAHAVLRDQLEQAELLEAARELRGTKAK